MHESPTASHSSLCFCFHFVRWQISLKQVMNFMLLTPPWEQRPKFWSYCIKKLFHNHMKFLHKGYWTAECLWHSYRPWTASCWTACAIFFPWVATVHKFLCNASFLLVPRLTCCHPAAPVWDKVETMVGADWAHTLVFMIASLIFSQSSTTGHPPPYSSAS